MHSTLSRRGEQVNCNYIEYYVFGLSVLSSVCPVHPPSTRRTLHFAEPDVLLLMFNNSSILLIEKSACSQSMLSRGRGDMNREMELNARTIGRSELRERTLVLKTGHRGQHK
jgi:hypothetical protein